jgi:hypothetical protein
MESDGKPAVFKKPEDTEIPALQKHTQQLTVVPRWKRAGNLIKDVRDLVANVSSYLSSEGMAAAEAEELHDQFQIVSRAR